MKTLLSIEWLKIKSYRTFWILILLFAIFLPLWNSMVQNGLIKFGGKNGINFLSQAYSFPDIWGNVGFWASIFVIFLSILVIILTTNEYSFRTHRQNVIDGWHRLQFYHAKIWLVLILSLAATVYMFLIGGVMGMANSGGFTSTSQLYKLGYFFLLSVNYMGFALILALFIRRSGLSIGLFMLYFLIVENILEALLNRYTDAEIGNFLPLQSSDELLPLPLINLVKNVVNVSQINESYFVMATIAWCAVYYFIGRRRILRSDW